jgi:molecular chaperone GrpE (heat shock protein)
MEHITQFFFNQGILGIIIIVLSGVIVWEEQQKTKGRAEIRELQTELNNLADKRLGDYRQIQEVMSSSLESLREAENSRSEQLRDLLTPILTIVQNLQNLLQLRSTKK